MPSERTRLPRRDWKSLWRTVVWNHDCRLCPERAETAHHIVPRNVGGDDVAENLAPLCGDFHRGCHGLIEHQDSEKLYAMRDALTGAESDYIMRKKGEAWLNHQYPQRPTSSPL